MVSPITALNSAGLSTLAIATLLLLDRTWLSFFDYGAWQLTVFFIGGYGLVLLADWCKKPRPQPKPESTPKPATTTAAPNQATPSQPATIPQQRPVQSDLAMLDGYKPEKWMLGVRDQLKRLIARKLSGTVTKGARPREWIVGEAFANLNTVTINISPADRADILYGTNFQTELLNKLPPGSWFYRAGNGRRYPCVVFPRRTREFIKTTDALGHFLAEHKSQTAAMLGFNDDMNTVAVDFLDSPHLLIFGETGGGKGVCIHNMLMSLMMKNTPAELNIVRCDPKGTELRLYDDLPHMLTSCVKQPLDICDRVAWLVDEMERRNDQFADEKVTDITEWNQTFKNRHMPIIVLAFDEMLDFYKSLDHREDDATEHSKLVTGRMESLINKGRSAGIHVIAVTQVGNDRRLKDIARGIKTVIAFACKKNAALQIVSDDGELHNVERLTGKGHGIVLGSSMTEFQSSSTVIKKDGKIIMDCREEIIKAIKQKHKGQPNAKIIPSSEVKKPEINPELSSKDELYLDVIRFVFEQNAVVQKDIQTEFSIGGGRSRKLIDAMEADGFIGPKVTGNHRRRVFNTADNRRITSGEEADNRRITSGEEADNVILLSARNR